ncbi:nucleolar protein 7 [Skeletonema marinoi]|uniref:Pescadillo homolog n=2 Tax=Skeletonema marinoi TaxID=267567 RepID=A0AAD8YDP1_9STRA|nr:nucleolar protein 7 [Skeletonema marinoi]
MGNRIKGRTKKKSIKAAIHSGSSQQQKLSRMGKVRKRHHAGLDATFIGRAKVLKKLQISLRDFRRLCILKGVYPRQPKKAPKNKKGQVFYHIKDVKALAHEPLLDKFREFRAFMKKVRRSANRHEKDEARRKEPLAPKYTLHHLVRERYPRFADALGDLDDALCLVHLFACLPSDGKIKSGITRKAQQLAASWGAYCSVTGSVTKSFISVKGVYLEADIMTSGQAVPVRWVTPHNFTQHIPEGVDFRVMLTFFEFYETLLGFVLFKLYGEMGVRYPLPTVASGGGGESNVSSATLHPTLGGKATSVLAANLSALQLALNDAAKGNSAADAVKDAMQSNDGNNDDGNDASDEVNRKAVRAQKKKQRELMQSIDEALKGVEEDGDDNEDDDDDDDFVDEDEDQVPIAAPLREALEAIDDSATSINENGNIVITSPDAQKRHQLFHNMTFFLSREVPRGYLELIILSYGGKVGWEGQDSPILMDDSSITHHVVDRPKLLPSYGALPKSREYIQPQWVLDSANFNFILPVQKYGVGHELPPHLSPWVDDNEEGYVPKYKEEIEKIRNGEMLDENEADNVDSGAVKAIIKDSDEVPEGDDSASDEDAESIADESEEDVESEEEDDAVAERKAIKKKQTEDEEAAELAKALMSKKAARLYGRMQHGIAQKQAKVDNLHKKRREIESTREKTKDGKTQLKLKVERLKKERREKEDKYKETGGSMKKKRRHT